MKLKMMNYFSCTDGCRRLRRPALGMALCLCLWGFAAPLAAASSVADRLKLAEQQLGDPATASRAMAQLQRLAQSRDQAVAAQAQALMAGHQRVNGGLTAALRLLEPYAGYNQDNISPARLPAFLERARCLAANGQVREAVKLTDYAVEHSEGHLRAAALACGADLAVISAALIDAIEAYRNALKYGDVFYPKTDPERYATIPGAEAWQALRLSILARLQNAEMQWDAQRYGADFAHYIRVRELHLRGKFAEALAAYNRLAGLFPGSVYAEAAQFYRERCRIRLKQSREAAQNLRAFIARQPLGLYRGEALYALGELYALEAGDMREAAKFFAEVKQWVAKVRAGDREIELFLVPEAARTITEPPDAALKLEGGLLVATRVEPRMVINRRTAPWYLDQLHWNACYHLGFLEFIQERYDEAMANFKEAYEINQLLREQHETQHGSFHRRLEIACRSKRLLANQDEMRLFKGRDRLEFFLADFYALWERWADAEAIYKQFLGRQELTKAQKSCILRSLAQCEDYKPGGDRAKAEAYYRLIIKDGSGTPSEQRALFALGQRSRSGASIEEQLTLLDRAWSVNPRTDEGEYAMYWKGFFLHASGHDRKAAEVFTDFQKQYPRSRFADMTRHFLKTIASKYTETPRLDEAINPARNDKEAAPSDNRH